MHLSLNPRSVALYNRHRKVAPGLTNRKGEGGELYLYDAIGDGGITDKAIAEALAELRDCRTITLYVNSPGGDLFQGLAIHAQLARFAESRQVVAIVDGIAASAASLVICAASRIEAHPASTIMIHEVQGGAIGAAADLEDMAVLLRAETRKIAAIYADRTGLPVERISEMLAAETWLSAQEALADGFIDGIVGQPAKPANKATDARIRNLRIKAVMGASARQAPGQPGK